MSYSFLIPNFDMDGDKMAYIDPSTKKVVYGTNGNTAVKPADVVNNAIKGANPQPYNGEPINANIGALGLANQLGGGTANTSSVPYAQKVTEAINTTNGNSNNVPQMVPQNNTPKVNPADVYKQGYEANVSNFKAGQVGNSMDSYNATETQRVAAEAEAIRARVRAAIAEGVNAQNKIINDAPAQFVDPMNRASFQGMKNLDSLKESLAKRGRYFSGDMDMAEMINNNQTAGNINDLENTKAKVISDAQATIANLQASGSLQEAQLVQEAAARSLERLQAQQNIIENRSNENNLALFNNATNSLKTQYDIGANDRQLGMQERTTDANLTGIDSKTGLATASTQQFNKQFDATQAQQTWENSFKQGTYDYAKERDLIGDTKDAAQAKFQLDQFEWTKNPDNPAVKNQIISNTIKDLELSRMKDPNSNENQLIANQVAVAKDQLAKLQAISPDMTVRQYNANLDQIYQGIAASKANVDQGWAQIAASKAKANDSVEKFDSNRMGNFDDYNNNIKTAFVSGEKDEFGRSSGKSIVDKKGIYDYLTNLADNGEDPKIVDSLANAWGVKATDYQGSASGKDLLENFKNLFR